MALIVKGEHKVISHEDMKTLTAKNLKKEEKAARKKKKK